MTTALKLLVPLIYCLALAALLAAAGFTYAAYGAALVGVLYAAGEVLYLWMEEADEWAEEADEL